jgi:hypothetical protein
MPLLHDPQTRTSIKQRLSTVRPDATRRWGKMSVDQMLHHVNRTLEAALGRRQVQRLKAPLPRVVLKFLVLNVPWPKGAPSAPEFVVGDRYDFAAEQARCQGLIDEFVATPLDATWPAHFSFGSVSGKEYSQLHAKHLNHHLRQFSA